MEKLPIPDAPITKKGEFLLDKKQVEEIELFFLSTPVDKQTNFAGDIYIGRTIDKLGSDYCGSGTTELAKI